MKITPSGIYVVDSKIPKAGYGVFAARDFKPGEVIERCPVVAVLTKQWKLLPPPRLVRTYCESATR